MFLDTVSARDKFQYFWRTPSGIPEYKMHKFQYFNGSWWLFFFPFQERVWNDLSVDKQKLQ